MMMATVAYFAHKNGWGSDSPFSWSQLGSATIEVVVVMMFPIAVWVMVRLGLSTNVAIGIALAVLLAADWYFDFSAVMAAPWIGVPGFVAPVFDTKAIALIAPVFVVLIAENLGHIKAIGAMTSRTASARSESPL